MPCFDHVALYFDGASRNNPRGPAGCGWALYEADETGNKQERIARGSKQLGHSVSNNQAEYRGLIEGLRYIDENITCDESVYVRGDSEVVIKQMLGEYMVRSANIRPLYNQANELEQSIRDSQADILYEHIGRKENVEADRYATGAARSCK
jgi:ribonuclease HI